MQKKPFFVHDALQNLAREGKVYEYAFWNYRGAFREEHRYRDWPSVDRVREVWDEGERVAGTGKEDLMFFPIVGVPGSTMVFWNENLGPIDNEVSKGSFFGGTPKAIEWWARTYYTYHNHYLSLDVFVGKDHSLINALLLLFPSRFISVYPSDPSAPAHLALARKPGQAPLGLCGAERFYYQFWLAGGGEQEDARERWVSRERWRVWGWWREDGVRCAVTRVVGVMDVLRGRFGEGWGPGGTRVRVPKTLGW
ncbi:hypothetical protein B0H34DRAFT_857930 [Crassisporium funariophilum]|nr:hypothetical protein B0H34DRAFT_857930 [Crassisporium funariophilum]